MDKFSDCPIGRRVEINVAKMQKDIDFIKQTNTEQSKNIEKILTKIDGFDDKYASKDSFNKAIIFFITTLVGVVGSLIKFIFF